MQSFRLQVWLYRHDYDDDDNNDDDDVIKTMMTMITTTAVSTVIDVAVVLVAIIVIIVANINHPAVAAAELGDPHAGRQAWVGATDGRTAGKVNRSGG